MNPSIIFDHDIGTNPDDYFALLLLLHSTEADVKLLISGNNFSKERALFAQKVLNNEGIDTIQSFAGEQTGHIDFCALEYIENYSPQIEEDYLQKAKEIIDHNEHVIWVAIQGLSNLAQFLQHHPKYADRFDIVHMGMTTKNADGYIGGGTNMEADPLAAKYVYELQLKRLRVVGSHTTINDAIRVHPETELYKKLERGVSENHRILLQHLQDYHDRRGIWPALHDPLTASVALGKEFVQFTETTVTFDDSGKYKIGGDTRVVISETDIHNPEGFMQLMAEAV